MNVEIVFSCLYGCAWLGSHDSGLHYLLQAPRIPWYSTEVSNTTYPLSSMTLETFRDTEHNFRNPDVSRA